MSTGKLQSLIIRGFGVEDNYSTAKPLGVFRAMFNPEKYVVNDTINYDTSQSHGNQGSEPKFLGIAPKEMRFELFIDGTGASGTAKLELDRKAKGTTFKKKEVLEEIDSFKQTTGYFDEKSRNKVCYISWGRFNFICVLKQASYNYTLFRPDGTPLRAVINATFKEHTNAKLQKLLKRAIKRELSRTPELQGGDTLFLLSFEAYNDPQRYVDIARANELNTVMALPPLMRRILLPPIDKTRS